MTYHTTKPCTIDGCEQTINARGLCSGHYRRWTKGQDLNAPKRGEVQKLCTIEGCNDPHKAVGLCELHYRRKERGADMSQPKRIICPSDDVADRLKYYSKPTESGCIEWTGGTLRRGYGLVSIGNGKTRGAHIMAWELANGRELPPGMVTRHTCDNPPCINPDHLLIGTNADNANDMVERDRQLKGVKNPRAKLTDDDVREIRRLSALGHTQVGLARMYGVSQPTIGYMLQGKTWRHVT